VLVHQSTQVGIVIKYIFILFISISIFKPLVPMAFSYWLVLAGFLSDMML
jgi:hypothetical protein